MCAVYLRLFLLCPEILRFPRGGHISNTTELSSKVVSSEIPYEAIL